MVAFFILAGCASPAKNYAGQSCALLEDCGLLEAYGYGAGEGAAESCLEQREEIAGGHGEPASAESCIESTAAATCDSLYEEPDADCADWLGEDSL